MESLVEKYGNKLFSKIGALHFLLGISLNTF